MPNFQLHLSSAFFVFNKLFLERSLYVEVERLNVNSVDPDETSHYKPSHLDLHCLQKPISSIIAYGSEKVNRIYLPDNTYEILSYFHSPIGLTLVLLNKLRCHTHF